MTWCYQMKQMNNDPSWQSGNVLEHETKRKEGAKTWEIIWRRKWGRMTSLTNFWWRVKNTMDPLPSVKEPKVIANQKSPERKSFLRQEIQFQWVTHQRDSDIRIELYKVNKLSADQMVEILTVILCEDSDAEEGDRLVWWYPRHYWRTGRTYWYFSWVGLVYRKPCFIASNDTEI